MSQLLGRIEWIVTQTQTGESSQGTTEFQLDSVKVTRVVTEGHILDLIDAAP